MSGAGTSSRNLEAGRWEISHRNRVQLDIIDGGHS